MIKSLIYVGEIGVEINLRAFEKTDTDDLSAATTLTFDIQKPQGKLLTKTATAENDEDGNPKIAQIVTVDGDLNEAGQYIAHVILVEGSKKFIGGKESFFVQEKFKGPENEGGL